MLGPSILLIAILVVGVVALTNFRVRKSIKHWFFGVKVLEILEEIDQEEPEKL